MQKRSVWWSHSGFLAILTAALTGCGGGGYDGMAAPPAGGSSTGTLRVALTDAPACGFDHVYVTVDRVRVHTSSVAADNDAGWSEIVLNPAQRIDLLGLTNGVLAELGQTSLPADQYTQVRLVLVPNGAGAPANSVVPTNGVETPIDTPSATQSGLKLVHAFTVPAGAMVDLVLDFDACRSIVRKGNGGFNLKPVITVIPRTTTGIVGVVDPAIAAVTVSAQKSGVVIRSTTPNAVGDFVLSPIDPASSPYDVVVTAPGQATLVIANVPVTSAMTTRISTTAMPLISPVSAMGSATGKILPVAASGRIRALQLVGLVPKVEVAHANADAVTGDYALSLPIAAPLLAPYSTVLPLIFSAQSASAASYTLEAAATGYAAQTKPATVGAVPVVNDFTLVPLP